MSNQRYVSNDLSHFVGKGKSNNETKPEDVQYDILVNKIIKNRLLSAFYDGNRTGNVEIDLSKNLSDDKLIKYKVVCFCDIPESDLKIHTNKYGNFGISFKKDFLIQQGARPVQYIPKESRAYPVAHFNTIQHFERIEYAKKTGIFDQAIVFDTYAHTIIDLLTIFSSLTGNESTRYCKDLFTKEHEEKLKILLGLDDDQVQTLKLTLKDNNDAQSAISGCCDFIINFIFSFIKFFSISKNFEDPEHFYMEREWRTTSNVYFSLEDISCVFFPSKYAKQFRNDVPDYYGQITFLD